MMYSIDKSGDSLDPQFLTFRHNSPQIVASSGRSIYSQRFDYKSLQKYPILDTNNSQTDNSHTRTTKKIKPMNKQKNLRTVRSQQKYKQFISPTIYNAEQHNGYNENDNDYDNLYSRKKIIYPRQDQKSRRQEQESKKQRKIQKNLDLKSKLNKLVRNMKKEQRRQVLLDQQINQLQMDIELLDKDIEQQNNGMMELKEISQENMRQCNRIVDHIHNVSVSIQETAANLENLQESLDSSEISVETSKQDQVKDRVKCSKLKQNIIDLNRMRTLAQNRVTKLYEQIQTMQQILQQLKMQQNQVVRILGLNNQNSMHSNRHSHSHNSSSGSNIQNTYYY